MTILVVALGAVLLLSGALAIGSGYPIVEVERGWTLVISGSMALSCGIVTIALGLILHRLSGLNALFKNGRGVVPLPRERPARPGLIFGRNVKSRGGVAPAPAKAWESGQVSAPAAASRPLPSRAGAENEAHLEPASGKDAQPAPEAGERAVAWPAPDSAQAPLFEQEADNRVWDPAAPEGEGERPAERQCEQPRVEAREPEAETKPLASDVELSSIEAILRDELKLGREFPSAMPSWSAEPSPGAPEPVRLSPPAFGQAEASPEPAFPELAPAVCGDQLAIIGRYESEGASYVMYSDGSIEARTERAVFHFKSMAELKAFLQSQAENS